MGGKSLFPYIHLCFLCGRRVVFLHFYLLVHLGCYFFSAILLESVVGKKVYDTSQEAVVIMW